MKPLDVADLRVAANDWIKELAVSLKNVSLYSSEHPRGRDSITRSYAKLKSLLEGRPSVTLTRAEGRLTLENLPLDRDRVVAGQIYSELTDRGVQTITLAGGLTQEEYTNLIRCLLLKPERVHERGGLDLVLLDEGVSSISVNKARVGKVSETMDLLTDLSLMDLLAGRGQAQGGESLSALMQKDPAGLARALSQAAARRDRTPGASDLDGQSESVADSLERMSERAIEEKQRDAGSILADLGRILAQTEPEHQARIILDKVGPRSPRKNLTSAVENMPQEALADLVTNQIAGTGGDFQRLHDLLERTQTWRQDRSAALRVVDDRLRLHGVTEQERKDMVDHLMWAELDVSRRLQLLNQHDYLWKVDFQRVKEVLVKLFATDQIKEATTLIQKYLSGLLVEDAVTRRKVADNARYILHLIEKTGKGAPMLGRIAEMFFTRIHDEPDAEVHSRLAAGLAFLADLRLRNGELGAVLELMRRAEGFTSSGDPLVRERGDRLCDALSRVGNEKLFKILTDKHLEGSDSGSMEAAEILKRGGARSANYLIDRLAEEDDRGSRARLVTLLKEMGRGSSLPFTARLADTRWFLVRNVVHILGEIGDTSVVPSLREVMKHPDARVRKELVRTLMRLSGTECEGLIIDAIADPDRGVQETAVSSLSVLRGERSEGIILDIVKKAGPYAGVDTDVRAEAIASAGRMGLKEAIQPLIEILTKKAFIGFAESATLRIAAVQALGALGGDLVIETLRTVAQTEGKREVREAALAVLNTHGIEAT